MPPEQESLLSEFYGSFLGIFGTRIAAGKKFGWNNPVETREDK